MYYDEKKRFKFLIYDNVDMCVCVFLIEGLRILNRKMMGIRISTPKLLIIMSLFYAQVTYRYDTNSQNR